MLHDRLKKKHSMFSRFLFSYIIILLVPLAISVGTYYRARTIVKGEIKRANESVLKQLKNTLDGKILEGQGLAYQVSMNNMVLNSIHDDADRLPADGFNDYQIRQELSLLAASNKFINNIFVYYNTSKNVISMNSKLTSEEFYKTYYSEDKELYSSWEKLMERQAVKYVSPMNIWDGKSTIALMQSLPLDNRGNYQAKVVIAFDDIKLNDMLQNAEWINGGGALIYNSNNELLISSDSKYKSIDIQKYSNEKDFFDDTINGEKSVIQVFTSTDTGLKYVLVIPSKVFWQKIDSFRNVNFLGVVLFLLIGGITAYFMTKRNYNPLRKVIDKISEKAKITYNKVENNELDFIDNVLKLTIDEKETLKERLKSGQDILRENFLYKALQGRILGGVSLKDIFSQHDIALLSEKFMVLLISVENFKVNNTNWIFEDESEILGFIIKNVIEELSGKQHQGFVVQLDKANFACIINLNGDEEKVKAAESVKICEAAQDFLAERFGVFCTFSISKRHHGMTGIHKAYQEVLDAMEYRIVLGKRTIINYEAIENRIANSNNYYNNTNKIEQKLLNSLRNSLTSETAEGLVNEIFKENCLGAGSSLEQTKCFIYDMTSIISKIMKEVCSTSYSTDINAVNRLINCETILEFKDELIKILLEIGESLLQEKEQNYLGKEVMKFIDNNYYNTNISVNMLGESFDISPSYLSKLFREQNGMGILDYLCKVRIQNSKQLLKDSDLGISDIAIKTGFLSSSVYIRTFKKYEGITPGAFRELQQEFTQN